MKVLALFGAAMLLALPGAAVAADLIIEAREEASIVATTDWTGFYAGVHAGYGWGEYIIDDVDFSEDIDGWVAGVQAGYNYQSGNFVLGVEGDVSWADLAFETVTLGTDFRQSVDWRASLRGRVGYAIDSVLLYGSAGVEAVGGSNEVSSGGVTLSDDHAVHTGFVAGLGTEVMVTDSVSLRAEYLYHAAGEQRYTVTAPVFGEADIGYNFHTVTVGANFRF